MVLGLALGAIYKLCSIEIKEGMGTLFGNENPTGDAPSPPDSIAKI